MAHDHVDDGRTSIRPASHVASTYNQGIHWYMAIPNMREERLRILIDAYGAVLAHRDLTRELFAVL